MFLLRRRQGRRPRRQGGYGAPAAQRAGGYGAPAQAQIIVVGGVRLRQGMSLEEAEKEAIAALLKDKDEVKRIIAGNAQDLETAKSRTKNFIEGLLNYAEAGSYKEEARKVFNKLVYWKPLSSGKLLMETLSLDGYISFLYNALKISLMPLLEDPQGQIKLEEIVSEIRKRVVISEPKAEQWKPLMARSERLMSAKEGSKEIQKLLKENASFVLAMVDIDHLSKYHANPAKLAGKARIVIQDIINALKNEAVYQHLEIEQIRPGTDEAIILISNKDKGRIDAKLARKILEEIRKGVINLTYRRLGRGIITNISHLSGEKRKEIEEVLNTNFVPYGKDEMVIFDIYRGEGIENAWERQLEIWNAQMIKRGMMLKGGVKGFVPALSISVGAEEAANGENREEILEKASKLLGEAKE